MTKEEQVRFDYMNKDPKINDLLKKKVKYMFSYPPCVRLTDENEDEILAAINQAISNRINFLLNETK